MYLLHQLTFLEFCDMRKSPKHLDQSIWNCRTIYSLYHEYRKFIRSIKLIWSKTRSKFLYRYEYEMVVILFLNKMFLKLYLIWINLPRWLIRSSNNHTNTKFYWFVIEKALEIVPNFDKPNTFPMRSDAIAFMPNGLLARTLK